MRGFKARFHTSLRQMLSVRAYCMRLTDRIPHSMTSLKPSPYGHEIFSMVTILAVFISLTILTDVDMFV